MIGPQPTTASPTRHDRLAPTPPAGRTSNPPASLARRGLLALVVLAVVWPLAAAGQELTYRLNPELGVPYNAAGTTEIRSRTSFQGMDLDVTMTIRMEQEVLFEAGAEEDTVVGTYTFTALSAEFGGLPGLDQMPFDLNDIYQGAVGQSFTFVFARSGQVLDISGFDAFMQAMIESADLPEQLQQMM